MDSTLTVNMGVDILKDRSFIKLSNSEEMKAFTRGGLQLIVNSDYWGWDLNIFSIPFK